MLYICQYKIFEYIKYYSLKLVIFRFLRLQWLQSSNQSFWQLPEKYLKRSENSDSTLTEQKDSKETWNNDRLYIEDGAKMIKTCAEQIDEMLLLIQNAFGQFRKYLNEWCRLVKFEMKLILSRNVILNLYIILGIIIQWSNYHLNHPIHFIFPNID